MWRHWGWVVVVTFLLLFTLAKGILFSYSELLVAMSNELDASMKLLNWIGSVPLTIAFGAAPLSTYTHYKFGAMKTVLSGIGFATIGLVGSAFVPNAWALLVTYGLIVGLGMTLIINAPFILLAEYFPYYHPRHVLTTSVAACGMPMGVLIFNPLCYEFMKLVGWQLTFAVYGGLILVLGLPLALTFREAPITDVEISVESNGYVVHEEAQTVKAPSTKQIATRTKWILGTLWLFTSTLKSWAYFTPFFILVKQMSMLGIPQAQGAVAMIIMGLFELGSRLLTSFLGDFIKGKILYMYIICMTGLCIQNLLGSFAQTYVHLAIYGAVQGVFGGPILAAIYSVCSEVILGEEVPLLFSIFRVGMGLGYVIGPIIAGAIFDSTNSFLGSFMVNAAMYFVNSILCGVIIYLNKKTPKWCFPDAEEETHLMNHMQKTY